VAAARNFSRHNYSSVTNFPRYRGTEFGTRPPPGIETGPRIADAKTAVIEEIIARARVEIRKERTVR
jgi:hypothetical protein